MYFLSKLVSIFNTFTKELSLLLIYSFLNENKKSIRTFGKSTN